MLAQAWTWVIGMALMSGAQHIVGLMGAPRRTKGMDYGPGEEIAASWDPYMMGMAIGGTVLFVSVLLAVGIVFHLAFRAPRANAATRVERAEYPLADPPRTGLAVPAWLERWRIWIMILAVLIIAAYAVPVLRMLQDPAPRAKPFTSFKGSEGGDTLPTQSVACRRRARRDDHRTQRCACGNHGRRGTRRGRRRPVRAALRGARPGWRGDLRGGEHGCDAARTRGTQDRYTCRISERAAA